MTIPGLREPLSRVEITFTDAGLLPSVETVYGGQETYGSRAASSIIDGRLNHFKEVGIMEILTSKSSRWLSKTTAAGMIPLLLAQVLISLVCVPETLNAGTEIRHEMTIEELREFLSGEELFTVLLSEGGAVRGNGITILADSIRLDRITRATNGKRYAIGSETSIAIGSVKEIRVEKMRGSLRHSGAVGLGILGGCFFPTTLGVRGWWFDWEETWRRPTRTWIGLVIGTMGGASLGYWLGKRKDHEPTIITIVD